MEGWGVLYEASLELKAWVIMKDSFKWETGKNERKRDIETETEKNREVKRQRKTRRMLISVIK